jgi:glycerol-3-phosphate O-acyltransferase
VLEAETLIEDHLAELGKSRYIISDDEFSDSRTVASFTSRVLQLDANVYVRFGRPLDPMGNDVDDEGRSVDATGRTIDRVGYVTDKQGDLVRDAQRDAVYTSRLAASLCKAYQRDNTVLTTHLAARAAWKLLQEKTPRLDLYQRILLAPPERTLDRAELLTGIQHLAQQVHARAQKGKIQSALPRGAEKILEDALDKFARYHTRKALEQKKGEVIADPKLCLYYGNRLEALGDREAE